MQIKKLITEQVANRCKIPKKMKFLSSKKKVTDVINMQISNKMLKRFKNFGKKSSDRHKSLDDMPEIIKKLAPTDCANNKGKPLVTISNSINLKYPKSQKKW